MGLFNWLFGETTDPRDTLAKGEEWATPEEWFTDTDGKRVRRKKRKCCGGHCRAAAVAEVEPPMVMELPIAPIVALVDEMPDAVDEPAEPTPLESEVVAPVPEAVTPVVNDVVVPVSVPDPVSTYSAPEPAYVAPVYSAPEPTYSPPSTDYGSSGGSYGGGGGDYGGGGDTGGFGG